MKQERINDESAINGPFQITLRKILLTE